MNLDVELPRFIDDDPFLQAAEPFPTMAPPVAGSPRESQVHRQESESTEPVEAPLRRKRPGPRELPKDNERQELHSTEVVGWKDNYLANMAEASEAKKTHKANALARTNAAFWVVGAGIGGVGAGVGSSKLKSPLDMFAGDAMLESLTGIKMSTAGQKRAHDGDGDEGSDSEARRTRARGNEGDEIGRGEGLILQDDDNMIIDPYDVGSTQIRILHS